MVRFRTWLKQSHLRRSLIRLIMLIICSSACAIQCALITSMYLEYPTTVYVYKERMETLETPGITICNDNR